VENISEELVQLVEFEEEGQCEKETLKNDRCWHS
jgi:hypothetical protein